MIATLRTPCVRLSETGRLATAGIGQHKNTGALKISAVFRFSQKIFSPNAVASAHNVVRLIARFAQRWVLTKNPVRGHVMHFFVP